MVKPGYKQTEIGSIPEDWDIVELKEAFPKLEAGVSVNSDSTLFSDYYVLKTSAVHDGRIDCDEAKPVIARDYNRLKCPLVPGSIVFSRMNTPQLVGECGYVKEVKNGTFLPDRLWLIRNPVGSEFDFEWLNYLLNTRRYRDAVRATATGTSNSMKNISKDRLLEIFIPKPKIDEQKRIAEALSDIDALINNLEELVAKKKAIKQGAMQELLTGKKRLPGFADKWIKRTIGDMACIESGGTPSTTVGSYWNGKISWCTPTDITENRSKYIRNTEKTITKEGVLNSSAKLLPKGTILLCTRATIGESSIATDVITTNQGFKNLVCNDDVYNEFLYYAIQMKKTEMVSLAIGSTFLEISKNALSGILIDLPDNGDEQVAIASVLSDIDEEIELLEQKLAKYRQLKQGMMQQLLTGRIRLV